MTVMVLTELDIKDIWAKALTPEHGQIAQRIGAHHVVHPEAEMGERIAHLITGKMVDYVEFGGGFAIARIYAPTPMHNRSLADSGVLENFSVTIVAVSTPRMSFSTRRPARLSIKGIC